MRIAHRFEDIVAWQLAAELRDGVNRLTEDGRARQDGEFCGQIRDSAASAPRNIAEGFARFKPRQFAYFSRIARGSLAETRNHLLDGIQRAYWPQSEVRPLLFIQYRAFRALTGLIEYLDSLDGEAPAGWDADPLSPSE